MTKLKIITHTKIQKATTPNRKTTGGIRLITVRHMSIEILERCILRFLYGVIGRYSFYIRRHCAIRQTCTFSRRF